MSQWKPKKRSPWWKRLGAKKGGGANAGLVDETAKAGIEIVELEGTRGWLRAEELEHYRGPYRGVQVAVCPTRGEVWVKVHVGRHRRQDKALLKRRLAMLEEVAAQQGGLGLVEVGRGPLWKQVEFLENVLEFRLRPPCGCPPCHAAAA